MITFESAVEINEKLVGEYVELEQTDATIRYGTITRVGAEHVYLQHRTGIAIIHHGDVKQIKKV